jgi:glycosyltransferase involved in cell wall biosynthesis
MASPLVSIVIPAYNSANYIQETLESCLAQTYPNFELIVIDDGSTDDTIAIVESYGDKIHLIQQRNSGPAIARNTGIQAAQGEYIQFCDSDDLLHPEKIAHCMAAMLKNPDVALVYSKVRQVAANGESSVGLPDFPPDDYFDTANLFCKILQHVGSPLQTSTLLVRKSTLLEVGMYRADPDQRCAEDWDLLLRLANDSDFLGVPEILTYYRHHEHTLTNNRLAMAAGRLQTAQYARHYARRKTCLSDEAYNQFEAGRHHILAMILWGQNRRDEARQHLQQAIRLTGQGRVMRRIAWSLSYIMPFQTFDTLLKTLKRTA